MSGRGTSPTPTEACPTTSAGVIEDPEARTLQTPESFFARFRVDMRVRHEVTALHPDRKTVSVKNLKTGEKFEEPYDKLILSPGAKPTQPRLPGAGLEKLFTLRTVADTFHIKDYINTCAVKSGGTVSTWPWATPWRASRSSLAGWMCC